MNTILPQIVVLMTALKTDENEPCAANYVARIIDKASAQVEASGKGVQIVLQRKNGKPLARPVVLRKAEDVSRRSAAKVLRHKLLDLSYAGYAVRPQAA